jgi:hypothetical protein
VWVVDRDLGQVRFGGGGVGQLDGRLTRYDMLWFVGWHFRSSGRLEIGLCPTSTIELLFGMSTNGAWAIR